MTGHFEKGRWISEGKDEIKRTILIPGFNHIYIELKPDDPSYDKIVMELDRDIDRENERRRKERESNRVFKKEEPLNSFKTIPPRSGFNILSRIRSFYKG